MRVIKGKSRVVWVLPCLGLVVKWPVIQWRKVCWGISRTFNSCPGNRIKGILNSFRKEREDYQEFFLSGFVRNWQEFRFWHKTRHPFIAPTYFSFFGLFNLQKFAERCPMDIDALWRLAFMASHCEILEDGHHFENPTNFGSIDKSVYLLDYGESVTQEIITEYGLAIKKALDEYLSADK